MPKVIAVMKVVENDTEARVFEAKQKVEVKKFTYIRFYYISKLTVFAVQTPTGKHIRWISRSDLEVSHCRHRGLQSPSRIPQSTDSESVL